jgi:NTP pyrophosphatase (non-canonical NTP hydrolase)
MDFDAYQKGAARTLGDDAGDDRLTMTALGLAGEAGEFVELVKKYRFHGAPLDREKAAKELGDVLWYVAAACTALGVSMDEVAAGNLRKLEARYPGGFSAEASAKRVDVPHDCFACQCRPVTGHDSKCDECRLGALNGPPRWKLLVEGTDARTGAAGVWEQTGPELAWVPSNDLGEGEG